MSYKLYAINELRSVRYILVNMRKNIVMSPFSDMELFESEYELRKHLDKFYKLAVYKHIETEEKIPKIGTFKLNNNILSDWNLTKKLKNTLDDHKKAILENVELNKRKEVHSFEAPIINVAESDGEVYAKKDEENPLIFSKFINMNPSSVDDYIKKMEPTPVYFFNFAKCLVDSPGDKHLKRCIDIVDEIIDEVTFSQKEDSSFKETAMMVKEMEDVISRYQTNFSALNNFYETANKIVNYHEDVRFEDEVYQTVESLENELYFMAIALIKNNGREYITSSNVAHIPDPPISSESLISMEKIDINEFKESMKKASIKTQDIFKKSIVRSKKAFNGASKFAKRRIWKKIDKDIASWFQDENKRSKYQEATIKENTFRDDIGKIFENDYPEAFAASEKSMSECIELGKKIIEKVSQSTDKDILNTIKTMVDFKDDGIDDAKDFANKAIRHKFFKETFTAFKVSEMYVSEAVYKNPLKPDRSTIWLFVSDPDDKPKDQKLPDIANSPESFRKFPSSLKNIADNLHKQGEKFMMTGAISPSNILGLSDYLHKAREKDPENIEYLTELKSAIEGVIDGMYGAALYYKDLYNFIPTMYKRVGNLLIFTYIRARQEFVKAGKDEFDQARGRKE